MSEGDDPAETARRAHELRRLEAILFAASEPIALGELSTRLPGADLTALIDELEGCYRDRGVNVRRLADRVQMVTAPDCADALIEHRTQERPLGRAALETLAIVAYHQPTSRAEIEEVRGARVSKGSLDRLIELGWIAPKGRRDAPGRPLVFVTTPAFLAQFGLDGLASLPNKSDLEAAGLLDARLPEGFAVPVPRGAGDELAGPDEEAGEFATDYGDGEA